MTKDARQKAKEYWQRLRLWNDPRATEPGRMYFCDIAARACAKKRAAAKVNAEAWLRRNPSAALCQSAGPDLLARFPGLSFSDAMTIAHRTRQKQAAGPDSE
jgi:hypothetical protein